MKTEMVILLIATLTTGLMAGLFFTWSNAITPGLSKLSDLHYLEALKSMNKTILNPLFFIVFLVAIVSTPIATFLFYRAGSTTIFKLLLVATLVYWLGVVLITFAGNIPLNNLLEKTHLENLNNGELLNLRNTIEAKWNGFNLIRSLTSFTSFLILIWSCLLYN